VFNYSRIRKECFWDLNLTEQDIEQIPMGNDERMKFLLMEKILLNSSHCLQDLHLFLKEDLQQFLDQFKVPTFNHDYVFRRKNIVEVFFFNKPLLIEELKWII